MPDDGQLFTRYELLWRGTRREVDLVYENVREMADERLRGRPGTASVILDFPFDEPHRSPRVTAERAFSGGALYRSGSARWRRSVSDGGSPKQAR